MDRSIDRIDGNVHDGCVDRALVHFDFHWIRSVDDARVHDAMERVTDDGDA